MGAEEKTIQWKRKPANAQLLVITGAGEVRQIRLNEKDEWQIGRPAEENHPDIPIDSSIVSRQHGALIRQGSQWFYWDRGSYNGTIHNNQLLYGKHSGAGTIVPLNDGDFLKIDSINQTHSSGNGITMFFSTSLTDEVRWEKQELSGLKRIRLGRLSSKADLVFPSPHISALHAVLNRKEEGWYLEDCRSHNGTWLNGVRVVRPVLLRNRDCIRICDYVLVFVGNRLIYQVGHSKRENNLEVNIHSKVVADKKGKGTKQLLSDIKFSLPGRLSCGDSWRFRRRKNYAVELCERNGTGWGMW